MVSYDIKALYPSIPQDEAISTFHEKMVNDPHLDQKTTMSALQVTSLFKTIDTKTYFQFNKKLYIQSNGLAIGASTSGFAADLYMEKIERIALDTFAHPPEIWLRYVDDTFSINNKTHIDSFLTHLNQQHPRIQEPSRKQ